MSWAQRGIDISGIYNQENIVLIELSDNGNILAVSEFQNGVVRIYSWLANTWNKIGEINGLHAGDYNGATISLSADGTTIAIGATKNNTSSQNAGMVRIFDYNGTNWNQRGLTIYGQLYERLGIASLSSDGNTVAVGAPWALGSAGIVRIYSWVNSSWTQLGVDISGADDSFSGEYLSLSGNGNVVAIGAPFYNAVDNNQEGYVRVFEYINLTWTQRGAAFIGIVQAHHLGNSVQLSETGNTLAFGIPGSNTVRIYDWNQSTWVQRGTDIVSAVPNENSGERLSLSSDGNIVSIVGPAYNNNAGIVRVYEWKNSSWTLFGNAIEGDGMGARILSTALSADGLILAVGTTGIDDATTFYRAYLYSPPVPCLPAGTRVLTAAGYKAVEELAQGDLIVTSEGGAVPFKLYSTDVDKAAEVNAPYLIPAHTFGKFPVKDLMLSPNHAFQSRPGIWQIPKYAALQYPGIHQVNLGESVTYYHIETPDYFKDNLVVDGTTVESFAHEQLCKGQIVYSYSARYNGFIRSQAARQVKARLTKS